MESIPETNGEIANRILRSLPANEYAQLIPYVEVVRLRIGQVLHEPGDEMPYVYFPNHGVLSMLTILESGEAVEIATVGNEGMADLSVFLGLRSATSRLINQVPGEMLRLKPPAFLRLVEACPGLSGRFGLVAEIQTEALPAALARRAWQRSATGIRL